MTIEQHYVREFEGHVHHEMQQTQSRLMPFVQETTIEGEDKACDTLGDIELAESTGRHQAINEVVPEHSRRQLIPRRYSAAILVDANDIHSVLSDPDGEYRKALMNAIWRRIDRIIAAAAFASVLTGKAFGTTTTFAGDGGKTVDASGGLTYAKILEGLKNFTNNEVSIENGIEAAMIMTGDEEETMMQISELTNGDFSRQFAVDNGRLTRAVGMDVVKFGADVTNPILSVTGGVRDNILLRKGGIKFGMKAQPQIVVKDLPERTETYKIEAIINAGAVRVEGNMVQKFQVTES